MENAASEDLATKLWRTVWDELTQSVSDARGPFRTVSFANITSDGPEVRTLVLRAVHEDSGELVFHTHRQSPKCEQLRRDSRAAVVAYGTKLRLQIRFSGLVRIETDSPLAETHWNKVKLSATRTYCTVDAPSSRKAAPTPNLYPGLERQAPSPEQVQNARANFAVLVLSVATLEVLSLNALGHRRVQWSRPSGWKAQWLAP